MSLRPFCSSVDISINWSIDWLVGEYLCLGFVIDMTRLLIFFSVDRGICVSVDILVGKCVLLSDFLLMCPSVHFVCLLINRLIDWQSIGEYWCLVFEIDTACPLIFLCRQGSPLIYQSGNASWCLLSYWYVPPFVSAFCWYINWLTDQSIGEYWCIWLEIDMARPRHRQFVLVNR